MILSLLLKFKSVLVVAIQYWKVSIIVLLLAVLVYGNFKIHNLQISALEDSVIISDLQSTVSLMQFKIEEQNAAVTEGNVKYNLLLDKQSDAILKISELDKSLKKSLSVIRTEIVGPESSDKIKYLRDSVGDLVW